MTSDQIRRLADRYAKLRIAVVGDFCLDRYLDIDPNLKEVSIETGREVQNVVRVRAQPGAAGTIVNNLVALGVGEIRPIGLVGDDGEGYELLRSLGRMKGVVCDGLVRSDRWRTFTYCKPMLMSAAGPATELNRLDSKNWSRMPADLENQLAKIIADVAADAFIVMDQVDREDTGIVTAPIRNAVARRHRPTIADSRRGLAGFPPFIYKMNAVELARLCGSAPVDDLNEIGRLASSLAVQNRQPVFVTLSERGILAAEQNQQISHSPALPLRGPIDIVGAGDCVAANLISALASGVPIADAMSIAMTASSIVVHQLGTTGTASLEQIAELSENFDLKSQI